MKVVVDDVVCGCDVQSDTGCFGVEHESGSAGDLRELVNRGLTVRNGHTSIDLPGGR